jgi:hypothetical protein
MPDMEQFFEKLKTDEEVDEDDIQTIKVSLEDRKSSLSSLWLLVHWPL